MKSLVRLVLGVTALAGTATFVASAQSVISAKSGLIHYLEGKVYLNDKAVESQFGSFPDVKVNATLRSEEGRAEVLLTPGVFLRIGENSAIRMVTNRLIDTRVEFLSGSALVEADELLKDNGVTIVYKDYTIQLQKKGVYRFDSDPAALRVYDGDVIAQYDGKNEEIFRISGHGQCLGCQIAPRFRHVLVIEQLVLESVLQYVHLHSGPRHVYEPVRICILEPLYGI